MKIVVDKDIPYLAGRPEAAGIETVYVDQWGFTPDTVRDADALLIRTRTRCDTHLLKGSKVKLIATATIGTDQIDTQWCDDNGIIWRNSPGCNSPAVAQYVWAALLRTWNITSDDITQQILPGKTLGIIGCGNVGSIVKEWGERLGVKILVSDPPKGFDYPLQQLLSESDAVTLHTPLTAGGDCPTYHLIGETELDTMKQGAILINAARGPVVDFKALKPRVVSGRIRAIIDTWEGEPVVDQDLLNIVKYGTFHIAGYSLQGKQRATRMVLEALEEVFGLKLDKSGLEPPYIDTTDLSVTKIINSYDPSVDTLSLRKNISRFDELRNNYNLRNEV